MDPPCDRFGGVSSMIAPADWLRAAGLAFAVTLLLIPVFARLSLRVGQVDLPNARKIHDRPVPLVGGLAIYCGVVAGLLLAGGAHGQVKTLLLISSGIIVLGLLDD